MSLVAIVDEEAVAVAEEDPLGFSKSSTDVLHRCILETVKPDKKKIKSMLILILLLILLSSGLIGSRIHQWNTSVEDLEKHNGSQRRRLVHLNGRVVEDLKPLNQVK